MCACVQDKIQRQQSQFEQRRRVANEALETVHVRVGCTALPCSTCAQAQKLAAQRSLAKDKSTAEQQAHLAEKRRMEVPCRLFGWS